MADAVTLAYLHPDEVSHSFMQSLMDMFMFDMGAHQRLARGRSPLGMYCTSGAIESGRNTTVKRFLEERDTPWFMWVDTDMGFAPDSLERLMAVVDAKDRPIVGGLCFGNNELEDDGMNGRYKRPFPTVMDWYETDEKFGLSPRYGYPVNSVVQCGATGAAFIVVHRSVFERIAEAHGEHWYSRIPHPKAKAALGEDTSFCLRAGALGIPVHVHTGVQTNHWKNVYLNQGEYMRQLVAPPAAERTAVIVPVMKRPQNAEPFMRSLRASTGLARVYAIGDEDDVETLQAWGHAGADVVVSDRGSSFPAKANCGYEASFGEPWLFLTGDDVRFHAGWLDQAQHVGELHGASVVATNDLGNPRVIAGNHATHPLIRRSYIDEQGASWDGPKIVCHEGYRHWYCDDEWTTVAKQRGVFAAALASIVEHRHPIWGKADNDPVYKKGQAHADQDRRLFERRLKANTKAAA